MQLVLTVVGTLISLTSVGVATVIYLITRNRENYSHLQERMAVYGSAEMLVAVRQLWEHYRKYGESKFVEKYIEVMRREETKIKAMSPSAQHEFRTQTLHYQRRIVTRFWRELAMLLKFNLIPRKVVYNLWFRDDVEIVTKIVLPIEDGLADHLKVARLPNTDLLYRLVEDKDKFYH